MKNKKKKSKMVNLAKAVLINKKCLGYCWQMSKGKYEYQNDNDLGLDLEGINCVQRYNRKIYIGNGYYFYVMWGIWGDKCDKDYVNWVSLKMVSLLLKECHKHILPLTKKEQKKCEKYWKQF